MGKYTVTFCQYSSYEVEAEDEDSAISEAYKDFKRDMQYPVANTSYDDVEVEEIEEEEED